MKFTKNSHLSPPLDVSWHANPRYIVRLSEGQGNAEHVSGKTTNNYQKQVCKFDSVPTPPKSNAKTNGNSTSTGACSGSGLGLASRVSNAFPETRQQKCFVFGNPKKTGCENAKVFHTRSKTRNPTLSKKTVPNLNCFSANFLKTFNA